MGCDIHSSVQVFEENQWIEVMDDWLNYRSYGLFGFLANVRNYSQVPVISIPRGLPADFRDLDGYGYHNASWLALRELLNFDYDQKFINRRCGGTTLPEEDGELTTIRDFLGSSYFNKLEEIKDFGPSEKVRVVFWFDN